jgi:hypothetical protein
MCLYVLSSVLWCPLRFLIKTMFVSSLHTVVCRRTHVLFRLLVFVCVEWCSTYIVLCFSSYCVPCVVQHILCCVFLRIVYPVLSISLDYPFLIAASVFSYVYLRGTFTITIYWKLNKKECNLRETIVFVSLILRWWFCWTWKNKIMQNIFSNIKHTFGSILHFHFLLFVVYVTMIALLLVMIFCK